MIDALFYIILGFAIFLLIRRMALNYVSRLLKRKLFEQEYFTVLTSPQFKVKSKYD